MPWIVNFLTEILGVLWWATLASIITELYIPVMKLSCSCCCQWNIINSQYKIGARSYTKYTCLFLRTNTEAWGETQRKGHENALKLMKVSVPFSLIAFTSDPDIGAGTGINTNPRKHKHKDSGQMFSTLTLVLYFKDFV